MTFFRDLNDGDSISGKGSEKRLRDFVLNQLVVYQFVDHQKEKEEKLIHLKVGRKWRRERGAAKE